MARSPARLATASLLLLATPTALAQPSGEGPPPLPINACITIAASGSYRLTQNLTAAEGADCLVVAADFVTLDLAGWALTGGAAAGSGISDGGIARQGIAVRNGTITGFHDGVALFKTVGAVVEAVRALNNRDTGILVGGEGSTIRSNTTRGNGNEGLLVSCPSTVSGNTATQNGGTNLLLDDSTVVVCNASDNVAPS